MKKKFLAGLLALCMALSLAACGGAELPAGLDSMFRKEQAPTAEDLAVMIEGIDPEKYTDMSFDMSAAGESDGLAMSMSFTAQAESRGGTAHIYDGSVSVTMSGLSMDIGLESWTDGATGRSWSKISMLGESSGWTADDGGEGLGVDTDGMSGSMSIFRSGERYSVARTEDGKHWRMDWTVPASALADTAEGLSGGMSFGDASAWALFERESWAPEQLSLSAAGLEGERSALDLTITFRTVNGDEDLSVPADIAAIEPDGSGTDLGGFGWGDPDFGYGSEGKLQDDGNGTDEILDALALELEARADTEAVYLHHYDGDSSGTGLSTLNWSADGDGWYGSGSYDRVTDASWYDPHGELSDAVEWTMDDGGPEPAWRDGEKVLFLYGDSGSVRAQFLMAADDAYLEIEVYHWSGDKAGAMEALRGMLDSVGMGAELPVGAGQG